MTSGKSCLGHLSPGGALVAGGLYLAWELIEEDDVLCKNVYSLSSHV